MKSNSSKNIQCPFTLQWPIPRSHLKDEPGKAIYSRAFIASNIPSVKYYFAIFPNGFSLRNREQTYLSLYLEYHENIKAEAKFKISIETANYQCEENHVSEKCLRWGKMCFTTEELFDSEKRFIVNGEMTIKIEGVLTIEKEEILKPWKSGNFDDSLCLTLWNQTESKDFAISVKGQEITAHKWVLALRSPVFEKMFESGMKEAKENKVEIPDFSFNIVESAIKRCYHQNLANESTSLETKMDMLQFFEKYDIQLLNEIL
uniref:BTB domain-containing protein n=1 Tax=Panagrolaimus davidi TaxID=227884 RepID=A0A914Q6M8_9BILA